MASGIGYLTVKQVAEHWGVTVRQVQRLLIKDRIQGAKKLGNTYLIPVAATKPKDLRVRANRLEAATASLAKSAAVLPYNLLTETIVLPSKRTTWAGPVVPSYLTTTNDKVNEALQRQIEAEYAIFSGKPSLARDVLHSIEPSAETRLCRNTLGMYIAISLGDYTLYRQKRQELERVLEEIQDKTFYKLVELSLAMVDMGMLAPQLAPEWLKRGDVGGLPDKDKAFALYQQAKYLQGIGSFEQMFILCRTLLSLTVQEGCFTITEVYLRLLCALACTKHKELGAAEDWLMSALQLALPYDLIMPFAENFYALGTPLQQVLERNYPQYLDRINKLSARIYQNWTKFHNYYTQENITLLLTRRELQIAQLVVGHRSYKEIAAIEYISIGRLKNILQNIYNKLGVSSRKELWNHVVWNASEYEKK